MSDWKKMYWWSERLIDISYLCQCRDVEGVSGGPLCGAQLAGVPLPSCIQRIRFLYSEQT